MVAQQKKMGSVRRIGVDEAILEQLSTQDVFRHDNYSQRAIVEASLVATLPTRKRNICFDAVPHLDKDLVESIQKIMGNGQMRGLEHLLYNQQTDESSLDDGEVSNKMLFYMMLQVRSYLMLLTDISYGLDVDSGHLDRESNMELYDSVTNKNTKNIGRAFRELSSKMLASDIKDSKERVENDGSHT